ncbi:hypothetical protein QJS83_04220 [Bdellovibrio sp. 22V]|uniref:hypothetical protein n=1 Tax=Bdellovibrio sp. 22V TaxID=3044166 RepID=UPI002542C0AC|nr:hypothetical protein [Bdellovibrio sp. 22V]WII73077.1 hypothetical protein QJS83_04220 [Bdellovibrio sp. 22V]
MAGCGKDGGGSPAPVNPVPTCPSGQVWNGNVCVNGNPGQIPTSRVQFYDYNKYYQQTGAWMPTVYNGDMRITDTTVYKNFLKEALAICDRSIGWRGGLADCNQWIDGSFQVSWAMDSSMKPVVQFYAYPAPSYFQYYFDIGVNANGVAFNPLILSSNNTYNLINQSKGFEIRAQGTMWNASGLRTIYIQVLNGTLADSYVYYDIYYKHPDRNENIKFATGKFKKF